MKTSIILLNLLISFAFTNAQSEDDYTIQRKNLCMEIKKCNYIESWCLGLACNSISDLYKKADSLFNISDLNDAVSFFNDTSYALKYYSFLFILDRNDSIAFDLLKRNIADTTKIDFQFADYSSNASFISLIADEYRNFIKMKYMYGGKCVINGNRTLFFPPKNKRLTSMKFKEFESLIKRNNIKL